MVAEEERLDKEVKRANNRILSVIERWPLPSERRHRPAWGWRELVRQWRRSGCVGDGVPETEVACIENLIRELDTAQRNLERWRKRMDRELARQRTQAGEENRPCAVDVMMQYRGIGREIALGLCWYVGDFRRFPNGDKFASYLGLVPVPWQSGTMHRDQGISKCGNTEARRLMVELAWLWIRYQPDSAITRKWLPRLEKKGRSRKTAIVAVARQLAVALLRAVKDGVEIPGAVKNRACPAPAERPGSPLAA